MHEAFLLPPGEKGWSRLDPSSAAPVGVALSGGGDSLALLHLTLERVRNWGRPVLALVVDHGLHPDGAAWTRFACAAAERAGATAVPLRWTGDKPATGLPAAARRARHALIAEAARSHGCRVVLFGHTADDVVEAAAMRAAGSSVGTPVEWAPSPVWPEGRGVFLLRPLLGVSRGKLRRFLTERGETWLEDPANADLRFARARARATSTAEDSCSPLVSANAPTSNPSRCDVQSTASPSGACGEPSGLRLRGEERGEGGWLELARDAEPETLARALLCVSGGERPPQAAAVERLAARLRGGEVRTATLVGARIAVDGARLSITREPGRAGFRRLRAEPGRPVVWDGRFEVAADRFGVVCALAGLAARLAPADRARLRSVPSLARPALPAFVSDGGSGPVLATNLSGTRCLVAERFVASCGQIAHEGEIDVRGVAMLTPAPYVG